MNKIILRLTEGELNRIIDNSVRKILNDRTQSPSVSEDEEELNPNSVYRVMRVVSVEPNTDKPSYYGKYKIGVTFDDNPNGQVRYQYGDIKPKVGDRFKQEFSEDRC